MIGALRAVLAFLLAIAGGVAYRMGGSGRYARFWRELGQGIAYILDMLILNLVTLAWQPIAGIILGFGICWAESTYFKRSGTDAKWWNWALVGAVFGVIPLPYCILTGSHWVGFGIRMPVCILGTVWWQQALSQEVCNDINAILVKMNKPKIGKDVTDEFGRGFINVVTLPLLLI